jgi:hypothetical protein
VGRRLTATALALVCVDFETLERKPKLSAEWFGEAARQNAAILISCEALDPGGARLAPGPGDIPARWQTPEDSRSSMPSQRVLPYSVASSASPIAAMSGSLTSLKRSMCFCVGADTGWCPCVGTA